MIGSTRAKSYVFLLALCALALLLALFWTNPVTAQSPDPVGGPTLDQGQGGPNDPAGPATDDPPDDQQPNPVPTRQTPNNGAGGPGDNGPGGNGNGNGNMGNGNGDMNGDDQMMHKPGPPAASASGRIVFHAATPAQLVKSGDGLQYYFVGADGSTVTGPHIPSFSKLAEMYPSGGWVPLVDAPNPLTGKQVNVDYIPKEMKIRVFTYYPDNEYDTNKQYIFNFGADYNINVEAW